MQRVILLVLSLVLYSTAETDVLEENMNIDMAEVEGSLINGQENTLYICGGHNCHYDQCTEMSPMEEVSMENMNRASLVYSNAASMAFSNQNWGAVKTCNLGSKTDCCCEGNTCNCCVHINLHLIKGDFCVQLAYNKESQSFTTSLKWKDSKLTSVSFKGTSKSLCVGVPGVPSTKACVELTDIALEDGRPSLCGKLKFKGLGFTLVKIKLGCFGTRYQSAYPLSALNTGALNTGALNILNMYETVSLYQIDAADNPNVCISD